MPAEICGIPTEICGIPLYFPSLLKCTDDMDMKERTIRMTGKGIMNWKKEDGAAQIVEASIVFPVMLIILIFMIFMGNAFFVKAQVESVVAMKAIEGAGYCADPILQTMKEQGSLPTLRDLKVEPYRYIFGGMQGIEDKIGKEVRSAIEGGTITAFGGMSPKLISSENEIAAFHNMVIYSTFSVEVRYKIGFPIRLLGQNTPTVLTVTSRSEVAVNDVSEFIRNTDMVLDLFHGTKIGQSISNLFGKINDFISAFAER